MGCSCAKRTDEYHGWECLVSGGECMFINPNSKACAEMYGEGPDAYSDDTSENSDTKVDSSELDEIYDEEYDDEYEDEDDEIDRIGAGETNF